MKGDIVLELMDVDKLSSYIQFEEDFIYRNCRSITSTPDIALTELVANAWDAGASKVLINIPDSMDKEISVEDDGIGMTDEEFNQRWMTLNYDRQKRQGNIVEFPSGSNEYQRVAYGRNGVGRHGMLCFSSSYTVETWKNGTCNKYDIDLCSGNAPFKISYKETYIKNGHGTKISTYVTKHLPDSNNMIDIISARFLYDPSFTVKINGKKVDLLQHKGLFEQEDITLENGLKLHITIIDSTKTALKSQQHGIAFWVGGRLVGSPSWTYGNFQFLDGRVKIAKRFTFIVQTDDLINEVLPDWTGFIDSINIRETYALFKEYFDAKVSDLMIDQIRDVQITVIQETRELLETLDIPEQRKVSYFIEEITEKNPIMSPDFLRTAVNAMISIEKSQKGEQLLATLCKMSPDEINKLSDLLTNWDIDDILAVLGEIDRRIIVVEAISRLQGDKTVDELHTLHPLVLNARWLFGTEFDSPMFVSNVALSSVIKTLFKERDYDMNYIANPRKRPDIVVLNNYSLKAVCTDRIDNNSGVILKPDQVLLIELKRGGFEIESGEVAQVENYVRQIKNSGALHKDSTIHAYVVGYTIGDVDVHKETSSGIIDVLTYGHLIETANQKLFRIKEQVQNHYSSLSNESIVEQALKEPKQMKFDFK